MKNKTIIEFWKHHGEVLPMAVRRNAWAKESYIKVTEVKVGRYPYGEARGIYTIRGQEKSATPESVDLAGTYSWEIADDVGLLRGEYKGKKRHIKIYGAEDYFDFGQYYHRGLRKGLKTGQRPINC